MTRLVRRLVLLSTFLWMAALLFASAPSAWAEITGNCEATLKGVNVRDRSSSNASDAIDVDEDEVVNVTFNSPAGFASHKIRLEFAGVRTTVSDKADDGSNQFTDSVNVRDYARWGAGLYKVIGEAVLTDGSTCSGAVLVNVDRNPLSTVAGIAAAGTTAVGAVGVAASSAASALEGARGGRKVEDWIVDEIETLPKRAPADPMADEYYPYPPAPSTWTPAWFCGFFALPALILTTAAMATGGGQPVSRADVRLPRATWRPRITVVSVLGGLLAGAGIVVLLQQYAVAPLTLTLAILGLAIGLAVGIVLPSLIRVWSVTHVNGKVAGAERRLNQAIAQRSGGPPAGGQPPAGDQPPPGGPAQTLPPETGSGEGGEG